MAGILPAHVTGNNEFNWSGLNSSFNLLIRVHLLRDSKDHARLLAIPKGSRGNSFLSQVLLVILALLECVWSRLANWKDV